ncbi:tyrosine-type recombinase/integrase [Geopsychrobacter electrodiphilus]|uniref:tyrosine-type recombinase/integrase n=1 Tax=Geopsychrobacter electrodiphilus TaxID=225196 RepID=UPI00037AE699|nr:tyrosine-type recombinase/integrase [Geopsychrobacter electrodiphilus]
MLESCLLDWMEHCLIQRGQQPRGVKQYERVVRGFFTWITEKGFTPDPERIAKDHITEWQRSIFFEHGNISNRTRASKLSALRSFFGFLCYSGLIAADPTKGIPSPKIQPSLAKKFSTEELRMLFAAPDLSTHMGIRDLAILKTLYAAGPRVEELVNLDTHHIHDTGGYIRIEIIGGKGGKSRTVTLRTRASRTLRDWLLIRDQISSKTPAIFIGLHQKNKKERISTRQILNIIKKYAALIGIESADAFCHKMRSTFASDLYDSGNDRCPHCNHPIHYVGLLEVQAQMGHEDPKTTQGYIAISDRVLRKTAIPDRRFREIEEEL